MSNPKSARKGVIVGLVLGSVVSLFMWTQLEKKKSEDLRLEQSATYRAQLALQKFREAVTLNDITAQLVHLETAVRAYQEAAAESKDDLRTQLVYGNARLQLARLRHEQNQWSEALSIRETVLADARSLLSLHKTDEGARELVIAACVDWVRNRNLSRDAVAERGPLVSDELRAVFDMVTPLDATRLATSEMHYAILQKLGDEQLTQAHIDLIDVALSDLMKGAPAASQPSLYASQIQRFINAAQKLAKKSENLKLQARFRKLNLDWRLKRVLLSPGDPIAKLLYSEALIESARFNEDKEESLNKAKALIEEVSTGALKSADRRRLFYALSAMASYLSKNEQTKEAAAYYEQAVAQAEKFDEPDTKELVVALSNQGFLLKRSGRTAESAEKFLKSLDVAGRCQTKKTECNVLWVKAFHRALKFGRLKTNKQRLTQEQKRLLKVEKLLTDKERSALSETLQALQAAIKR